MFGRILSVEVFDKSGASTFLVDPNQETKLMCSGNIEYLPESSGAPRAVIEIKNLPSTLANPLFALKKQVTDEFGNVTWVDDGKMIRVSFGYEDENGGQLQTIFVGSVARAFTTREDATTSVTKVYAYQLMDLFNSAVSSVLLERDTTIYACVEKVFANSSLKDVSYQIPLDLKNYKIDSDISVYGKTIDILNSLLKKVDYMISTTPLGVNIVATRPSVSNIDAVILAAYDEDGRAVAKSGLIGFPCIDTEGMRFETLINPKITLYSYVWLPNSIIIDERDGFVPSNQFGATFDPAGLYRVVKMKTVFDSHTGACKTSYLAVSAGTSSKYYK